MLGRSREDRLISGLLDGGGASLEEEVGVDGLVEVDKLSDSEIIVMAKSRGNT